MADPCKTAPNPNANDEETPFQKEQRQDDLRELDETNTSKKIASAMLSSSQDTSDFHDTLMKAVQLLNNQNGKTIPCQKNILRNDVMCTFFFRPYHQYQACNQAVGQCLEDANREG